MCRVNIDLAAQRVPCWFRMALSCAVQQVVEILLQNGMRVMMKDEMGHCPVSIAALYGHPKLVNFLVSAAG